jgi:hypothetical protein
MHAFKEGLGYGRRLRGGRNIGDIPIGVEKKKKQKQRKEKKRRGEEEGLTISGCSHGREGDVCERGGRSGKWRIRTIAAYAHS